MDDSSGLGRFLEEAPPSDEARQRALAALRARFDDEPPMRRSNRRWLRVSGIAAALAVMLSLAVLQRSHPADAWSETPVVPPDPALIDAAPDLCQGTNPATHPTDVLLVDQRGSIALILIGSRTEAMSVSSCTVVLDNQWGLASDSNLPFAVESMAGSVDEGLLGDTVVKAVIPTESGEIEVSYADGFFLVWWPQQVALGGAPIQFISDNGSILLEVLVQPRASDT